MILGETSLSHIIQTRTQVLKYILQQQSHIHAKRIPTAVHAPLIPLSTPTANLLDLASSAITKPGTEISQKSNQNQRESPHRIYSLVINYLPIRLYPFNPLSA